MPHPSNWCKGPEENSVSIGADVTTVNPKLRDGSYKKKRWEFESLLSIQSYEVSTFFLAPLTNRFQGWSIRDAIVFGIELINVCCGFLMVLLHNVKVTRDGIVHQALMILTGRVLGENVVQSHLDVNLSFTENEFRL